MPKQKSKKSAAAKSRLVKKVSPKKITKKAKTVSKAVKTIPTKMKPIFSKPKPAPVVVVNPAKFKSVLPKKELEEFKEILLTMRSKIAEDLQHLESDSLKKSTEEMTGDHADLIDTAHDEFEREFALNLASNEQQIMNKIDVALRKIKDGTYGICEKYGTPIPKKRLYAMPYATLCIRAQEEQEKGV